MQVVDSKSVHVSTHLILSILMFDPLQVFLILRNTAQN